MNINFSKFYFGGTRDGGFFTMKILRKKLW